MSRRCSICSVVIYGRSDRSTCSARCQKRKLRQKPVSDEFDSRYVEIQNVEPLGITDTLLATSWRPPDTRRLRSITHRLDYDAKCDDGANPSPSRIFSKREENVWPPQPSHCEQCGEERRSVRFNENPWSRDRGDHCPRCGAGRHRESPSYYDWLHIPRPGRPARSIVRPNLIMDELGKQLLDPEIRDLAGDLLARHAAGERWHVRKEMRKFLGAVQAKTPKGRVSYTGLSRATGIPKRTLYDMTAKGRKELAQKSQYDLGGTKMNVTEAPTLAQTVNVDHEKRIRELERQVGLPEGGDRAAEQAVEQLIEDSLGASTHATDDA